MIIDCRVIVDADGKVKQPGVHFGGKAMTPKLVRRVGVYALFHLPGGTYWDGSCHTHHPTRYELVKLSDVDATMDGAFTARVVGCIVQRKPGRKWQAAKRELLAKLHELAA